MEWFLRMRRRFVVGRSTCDGAWRCRQRLTLTTRASPRRGSEMLTPGLRWTACQRLGHRPAGRRSLCRGSMPRVKHPPGVAMRRRLKASECRDQDKGANFRTAPTEHLRPALVVLAHDREHAQRRGVVGPTQPALEAGGMSFAISKRLENGAGAGASVGVATSHGA